MALFDAAIFDSAIFDTGASTTPQNGGWGSSPFKKKKRKELLEEVRAEVREALPDLSEIEERRFLKEVDRKVAQWQPAPLDTQSIDAQAQQLVAALLAQLKERHALMLRRLDDEEAMTVLLLL